MCLHYSVESSPSSLLSYTVPVRRWWHSSKRARPLPHQIKVTNRHAATGFCMRHVASGQFCQTFASCPLDLTEELTSIQCDDGAKDRHHHRSRELRSKLPAQPPIDKSNQLWLAAAALPKYPWESGAGWRRMSTTTKCFKAALSTLCFVPSVVMFC